MLKSFFSKVCPVALPVGGSRQLYMGVVDIANPQPLEGFEDYFPSIKEILSRLGLLNGTAYATIDEKVIEAGMSQRRPGPHVDGHFLPEIPKWGGGGGWNHNCNIVPLARMPVVVAASVIGCRAWEGEFDAQPKEDGDLSHAKLDEGILLDANTAYVLSPDCIHESLKFDRPTQRSFLRLALPVGSVQ